MSVLGQVVTVLVCGVLAVQLWAVAVMVVCDWIDARDRRRGGCR
jgi:hypothetical protein